MARSNRPPPMQVEFFGLPGSGKTTLARALMPLLAARDPATIFSPCVTRDELPGGRRALARVLLILRGLPGRRADWRAIRSIAAIEQPHIRDSAKSLFNYMTVASMYRHVDRAQCSALTDQGILQAIWSAHLRASDPFSAESWEPLLSAEARTPKLYVCVETPVDVCMSRLESRPERHSRMQSGEFLRDLRLWNYAESVRRELVDGLISSYQRLGLPPRVVRIDGVQEPEASANGLLTRVREDLCR